MNVGDRVNVVTANGDIADTGVVAGFEPGKVIVDGGTYFGEPVAFALDFVQPIG